MPSPQLTGSIVAIVTPMQEGGALDLGALARLIEFHIESGTSGVVIVGTTGESPTVDYDEHCLLIKSAVELVRGRIPVIAGTGANSTSEAVELTAYAKEVGATACLSVVPYYNKPTQEGLYRHFRTIAERVDLPLILYNVPGRTVADLANDTVLRLAEVPGIAGIKDATSDMARHIELLRRLPSSGASRSTPATTTRRCPTSCSVATASSRSPPTSRRGRWPICAGRHWRATCRRHAGSTTG